MNYLFVCAQRGKAPTCVKGSFLVDRLRCERAFFIFGHIVGTTARANRASWWRPCGLGARPTLSGAWSFATSMVVTSFCGSDSMRRRFAPPCADLFGEVGVLGHLSAAFASLNFGNCGWAQSAPKHRVLNHFWCKSSRTMMLNRARTSQEHA